MSLKPALLVLLLGPFAGIAQHRVNFTPSSYYRNFSHKTPPVARLVPGDTLISETVDALGFDKSGTRVTDGGNPQTGPFYIEGAKPGDILVVHLTKVELNRDFAFTLEQFVKRSLPEEVVKPVFGKNAKLVKWSIDHTAGYASPQTTHEHLSNLKVPLRPFLGCLAVAAPISHKEPQTFFAGPYGGNMDFFKVTTGATIYLPVFHEGALLYIGDAHAAQGDGEITGDALETSVNFSLVTSIVHPDGWELKYPRMEDREHIVSMATAKTLEEAIKLATLGLLEWIQHDYHLSLNEATQVLGPSIEYRIPTLAGPQVEVVALLKKEVLSGLVK